MRDRLRKYRKEDQAEKRFGKDINVSTKDEAPLRKPMTEAETKSVSEAKPGGAKPMAGRSSFGAAFAAARRNPEAMKAGKFTWRGKEYSTALAGEKKSAPVRRTPTASAAPAKTQAAPTRASIPAPAKAVADKAAGYRAAFQRQDGRAGFSKSAPKAEAPKAEAPKAAPKSAPKGDAVKRVQSSATAGSRSLGLRPANFAPVSEARRKQIEEAQRKGYAKGGKIDGIAQRGKTRAPMRRK